MIRSGRKKRAEEIKMRMEKIGMRTRMMKMEKMMRIEKTGMMMMTF